MAKFASHCGNSLRFRLRFKRFASDCGCDAVVQGPLNLGGGGFKRGGFPIWTCPSFFVLFCPFWDIPDFSGIFLICSGMVRGFSRFVLFLFLGLLRVPTRNSPERVRDTIWTFPKKVGNTRVWKPPGLASLKRCTQNQTRQNNSRIIEILGSEGNMEWRIGRVACGQRRPAQNTAATCRRLQIVICRLRFGIPIAWYKAIAIPILGVPLRSPPKEPSATNLRGGKVKRDLLHYSCDTLLTA